MNTLKYGNEEPGTTHKEKFLHGKTLKCIWMTAGQIAYKLCDYSYNCKFCPLNMALGGAAEYSTLGEIIGTSENAYMELDALQHISGSGIAALEDYEKKLFEKLFTFAIKTDLYYNKIHSWAELADKTLIKTGVDSFISNFLFRVKDIILPREGNILFQGQPLCWIIDEHGSLTVISPVSGTVMVVNEKLLNNFSLIRNEQYDSGWILKIKPFDIEKDKEALIYGNDVAALFLEHTRCLSDALIAEKRRHKLKLSKKANSDVQENGNNVLIQKIIFKNFLFVFNRIKVGIG